MSGVLEAFKNHNFIFSVVGRFIIDNIIYVAHLKKSNVVFTQ